MKSVYDIGGMQLKVTLKLPNLTFYLKNLLFVNFRFTLGSLVMMPFIATKEPFASSHTNQHGQYKDQGFGMSSTESH
jgi:hypothetical protein